MDEHWLKNKKLNYNKDMSYHNLITHFYIKNKYNKNKSNKL